MPCRRRWARRRTASTRLRLATDLMGLGGPACRPAPAHTGLGVRSMLTRQSLIALGIALFLGVAAVFLANTFLTGREKQAYSGGTTKVAVAASQMAYGSDITADKIRFVDYPNSSIPPGAFTDAAQLMPAGKKRVALLPIGVNE